MNRNENEEKINISIEKHVPISMKIDDFSSQVQFTS